MLSEAGADCGEESLLRDYEARPAQDRQRVSDFTDQIVRVFSNRVTGLRGLRHLGLLALDLAQPLKQAVMWKNPGLGPHSPLHAPGYRCVSTAPLRSSVVATSGSEGSRVGDDW